MALVERLCAVIAPHQQQITQLQAEVATLRARVKALEDQLALNSHNSSKPPSSDAPGPRTRSLREPSRRQPGAQPGHPGRTLKLAAAPARVVRHAPQACHRCGTWLAAVAGTEGSERRQVFDVPPLKLEVTEHRVVHKTCPTCGHENQGVFPADVTTLAQYGSEIKALAVLLVHGQLLPGQRTCQLLSDLFGQPIAEGTLPAAIQDCAAGLQEVEAAIKQAITQAAVAHFDETGCSVADQRQWLHTASTRHLTHDATHPKRGAEATQAIGILPHLTGTAQHDAFASSFTYDCAHAMCNAHHLRELTFIQERMGQVWAAEMKRLLREIKTAVEAAQQAGHSRLSEGQQQEFITRYRQVVAAGLALPENQPPPPSGHRGRVKQTKAKNLLDRLHKYEAETLAFMRDFRVAFDNNQAEPDLRMVKVQQKVPGCFRTTNGAQMFCRIRGHLSTMKKQGVHILSALKSVFSGKPLMPEWSG
jgi:transposase